MPIMLTYWYISESSVVSCYTLSTADIKCYLIFMGSIFISKGFTMETIVIKYMFIQDFKVKMSSLLSVRQN